MLKRRFSHTSNPQQFNNLTINQFRPGQALVILLVFVATATIITAGAVTVTIINSQTTSKLSLGEEALAAAEAGAENAIARILLNPDYTGEVNLPVGQAVTTITVTGASTKTIVATGQIGSIKRNIQVIGSYSNLALTITSWQEIN